MRGKGAGAVLAACGLAAACATPVLAQSSRPVAVDTTGQSLTAAVTDIARRSQRELLVAAPAMGGRAAPRLKGRYTLDQALPLLLAGSGLAYRRTPDGTYVIYVAPVLPPPTEPDIPVALPELLVTARSQNSDIKRTQNDIQPYKVWNSRDLALSHAETLDGFLRDHLASNGQVGAAVQDPVGQNGSSRSEINLRGLGANQTLVLIDGRRLPGLPSNSTAFLQPDINGVPLSAIDRIEVLTATSGGIYGAGAMAGTVNIVMKRDYRGADLAVTYGDTDSFDASTKRIDGRIGFTPDGGRTDVMVAFSYSQGADLRMGERDYRAKARARRYANDPASYLLEPPASTAVRVSNFSYFGPNYADPLVLKDAYGGGALGASSTFAPAGYRGLGSDGGAVLLANAGKVDAAFAPGLIDPQASLITRPEVSSALFSVRRRFGDRVEAYFDGLAFRNEGRSFSPNKTYDDNNLTPDAPANPFTTLVTLSYAIPGQLTERRNRTTTTRATGGLIIDLPAAWKLNADYTLGEAKVRSVLTEHGVDADYYSGLAGVQPEGLPALFPLGGYQTFLKALDAYRRETTSAYTQTNSFRDVSARLAGNVMDLPGGPLTLSLLAEDRREHVPVASFMNPPSLGFVAGLPANVTQTVRSYYAEARAPLIPRDGGPRLLSGLELQLAARRDAVRSVLPANLDDGLDTNNETVDDRQAVSVYTLGLRFFPLPGVMLRSSAASGFLPPAIGQLASATTSYVANASLYNALGGEAAGYRFIPPFAAPRDARRGGEPIGGEQAFGVTTGGSRANERARSVSVGMVATPRALPGLRFSVDYTRIAKTGEPVLIHDGQAVYFLENEDLYPGRITRAPLSEADRAKGYTVGAITGINVTSPSVGKTTSEAVDFQLDYQIATQKAGDLRFSSSATWQPTLRRRLEPDTEAVNAVADGVGPLTWRGSASLEWSKGPWMLGVSAEYYDHYRVTTAGQSQDVVDQVVRFQGSAWIPRQVYFDLAGAYRFELPPTALARSLEVRCGIRNVLDHDAPVVADQESMGYSPYADPRGRRFELTLLSRF